MRSLALALAVAAALTISAMFIFEVRSGNVGRGKSDHRLALGKRKRDAPNHRRRIDKGKKRQRVHRKRQPDQLAEAAPSPRKASPAWSPPGSAGKYNISSPSYLKSEMVRVLNLRNRKVLFLLERMHKYSPPHISWSTISLDVKGRSYLLLLGWEKYLNPDFGKWKGTRHLSSIRKHPGVRCILVDIRTQATMLACTPEGKVVVNSINSVVFKIFREARGKQWEPIVFTHETSDFQKMYMLRVLESHISVNVEETWRGILATVRRCSRSSVEKGKIYNPEMSVVVRDKSTSYKEALCRDSVKFVYGKKCKIERVRPAWLKSPHSKFSLELDVFCKAEDLAVEYNGKQHYIFDRESSMKNRIEKDLSKLFQTRNRRVRLIVVPYLISDMDILRYIVLSVACHSH